jgi:SAM-dependent methyltransferase
MPKIEENYFTQAGVAAVYDSYIGLNMPFYWAAIEFLTEAVCARYPHGTVSRALEVGVGSGNFAGTLFPRLRADRLNVLDHSAEFLRIAQRKLLERLPYVPQTFTAIRASFADPGWADDLLSGGLDLVTSSFTFDHISDESLPGVFRDIHALLAPGGVFTIAEKCALADRQSKAWRSYVRSIDIRTQHNRNHRLKSEDEIVAWRRHNFEDDQMRSLAHHIALLERTGFAVETIGGVPLPAAEDLTYEQYYGMTRIEPLTREFVEATDQALGVGLLVCRRR